MPQRTIWMPRWMSISPVIVSGAVVPVLQRSWRPRSIGRHAATRGPRGHAILPSTKRALPRPWKCLVEFSRCPQASAVLHPRSANRFSSRPSIRLLQIPRHTNDRTSHMDARLRSDIHIFHSLALIVGGPLRRLRLEMALTFAELDDFGLDDGRVVVYTYVLVRPHRRVSEPAVTAAQSLQNGRVAVESSRRNTVPSHQPRACAFREKS